MLDKTSVTVPGVPPLDSRPAVLLACFTEAGYARIEPSILQRAAPLLDLGGEEIRTRLYFVSDHTGAELCLRPEYTIPVCQAYLDSPDAGQPAAFSYCGPVFRSGTGESIQAGLESFGRTDIAAADAEVLSLAVEAAAAAGATDLAITFGDAGLLAALLDGLRLPANWQRRLRRGLDKGETTATILAEAPVGEGDHSGVLAALAGADASGARALVNDLLAIAGISSVGGRTSDEIAERFLAQVALKAAPPFGDEQRAVLDRFLSISGHPDVAARALRRLADDAGLDLAAPLDLFEERTNRLAADDLDLDHVTYEAAFGRQFDYYTGFVFEARMRGSMTEPAIIGGGRYDHLARSLGARHGVPAVGASIWPDRMPGPPAMDV